MSLASGREALHHQLIEELEACSERAFNCRTCRNTKDIYYQPGATMICCDCDSMVVVLPDWNPRGVLRIWNSLHAQETPNARDIPQITKNYIQSTQHAKQQRMDQTQSSTAGSSTVGGNP